MATPAFFSGTGRRKTAVARVRLLPGEGEIVVNGRSLDEHFGNAVNEAEVRLPFRVVAEPDPPPESSVATPAISDPRRPVLDGLIHDHYRAA